MGPEVTVSRCRRAPYATYRLLPTSSQFPSLAIFAIEVFVGVGDVGDLHRLAVEDDLRSGPQGDRAQVDGIGDRRRVEKIPRRRLASFDGLDPGCGGGALGPGSGAGGEASSLPSGCRLPLTNSWGFCPWKPARIVPRSPTNMIPSGACRGPATRNPPAGWASCRRRTRRVPTPAGSPWPRIGNGSCRRPGTRNHSSPAG